MRGCVIEALAKLKPPGVVKLLIQLLKKQEKNKKTWDRVTTTEALVHFLAVIGDKRAIEPIAEFEDDKVLRVRKAVFKALEKLNNAKSQQQNPVEG